MIEKKKQEDRELSKVELIDEALLKNVTGGMEHVNGMENSCNDSTGTDVCWSPCCFNH